VIGILGVMPDVSKSVKLAFRESGDVIVLLDGAGDAGARYIVPLQRIASEFSSSEYSKTVGKIVAGEPPAIDLAAEKRLIECLVALAEGGLPQSAHDVSEGGIAVTLAESCFATAGLGAEVTLRGDGPAENALFGERGARAVVSVKETLLARVMDTARQCGVAALRIGRVTPNGTLRIQYEGEAVVDSPVDKLRDAWGHSIERALKIQ
jgi:phosphoribosylformylglycinamidine synthase